MTVAGMTHAEPRIHAWIRHGVIGGIVAGLIFAMFEMVVAAIMMGADAFFMPLRMIGAMLLGQQALDPGFSLVTAAAAGVAVHMVLSILYGIAVAGAARFVPALGGSGATLVLFASVAGLALWLINFDVFAPIFGWNWFPNDTDPVVQFVAHTFFYGTVLGLYLNAAARRA